MQRKFLTWTVDVLELDNQHIEKGLHFVFGSRTRRGTADNSEDLLVAPSRHGKTEDSMIIQQIRIRKVAFHIFCRYLALEQA